MKQLFPIFLILIFLCSCSPNSEELIKVSRIKCSGFEDPLGTEKIPDFSWSCESVMPGKLQTAYQIIVSSVSYISDRSEEVWNTGKVKSDASAWIPYSGEELEPGKEYSWRVRVWDEKNNPSPWSAEGRFVTGLWEKNDWKGAKWIGYEEIPDSLLLIPGVHGSGDNLGEIALKRPVVPYFRQQFALGKKVTKALVFVCGLGQYELSFNGKKIGNSFLSPGWSDYRKTCYYNTYDVTDNLKAGANCIGAIVGNGFYNINRERYRKLVIAYGLPKLILKLVINYSDGTSDKIITDETWKTSASPVNFSSIYGGEDYDARLEQPGWNEPGFNDEKWQKALIVKEPSGKLIPEKDFPVKVTETFKAKKIRRHGNSYVFDFNQNASGIIKIRIKGKSGQEIIFTPGELLGKDSLVTQQASGQPYYFRYILNGDNEEVWMPRFTYYGFRYVQADGAVPEGYPNPRNLPVISEIDLLHTRNSSPVAGTFKCSNDLFNSIYTLIDWSVKSNLASVATDCPHREKLGWLEQTHLMGNSIKFAYDIHNLYDKIIDDMIEAQLDNGLVPDIAPEFVPFVEGFRDSPEWGSACIILPWDMYEWYGDISAVKKAYPMMKKYLMYLKGMSDNNILSHGLGDWFDLGPKTPGEAQLTPKEVTATSIYYYDAMLLGKMAELLGEEDDASFFKELAENIRQAFNNKFFNADTKVYSTGSQTAYSMPLFFGMVDDSVRKPVVENLVESIRRNNNALTAGDIGYRYLLRVLEEEGQSQLIYEMNSKTDVPGYGYQLAKGATSLTESWAALEFVSNNHMMLGHLMEWFYSGLGGISQDPSSNSYKKIIISPQIVGDITWAETSYETVNGKISTSWKVEENVFTITIRIPLNCSATVEIPSSDPENITINDLPVLSSGNITVRSAEGKSYCDIGSGEYHFRTGNIKQ